METTNNKVYTITFGDVAENHAKMQKIGTLHESGYSISRLEAIQQKLDGYGLTTEMVDLSSAMSAELPETEFLMAKVLVIRRGAQFILGEETTGLIAENDALPMDKRALMRGKEVEKRARWNLCFADEDQEPDYKDGKGRIVAWRHIPRMSRIRQAISEWTEDVLLNGEANYYYDISKCGIGFHGDGERRKVFAVRMGETMPLYFKWFQNSLPVSAPIELVLNDGDMYIMSEKAVGFDWLKKKTTTLRHSTGCAKFTGIGAVNNKQTKETKAQKKAEADMKKATKKAEADMKKAQKKAETDMKKVEADMLRAHKKADAKLMKMATLACSVDCV